LTSHFDNLAWIGTVVLETPLYKEIANWLFDICIRQADNKKAGWTFESWKQTKHGQVITQLYHDEFMSKKEFLDDCHDVLDHNGGFHLKVFDVATAMLIAIIKDAICEKRDDLYDVDKIKKRFPDLPKMLEKIGYKKEKWGWIKQ